MPADTRRSTGSPPMPIVSGAEHHGKRAPSAFIGVKAAAFGPDAIRVVGIVWKPSCFDPRIRRKVASTARLLGERTTRMAAVARNLGRAGRIFAGLAAILAVRPGLALAGCVRTLIGFMRHDSSSSPNNSARQAPLTLNCRPEFDWSGSFRTLRAVPLKWPIPMWQHRDLMLRSIVYYCAASLSVAAFAQQHAPTPRGQKEFAQSCGFCHATMPPARAPDLVRSTEMRAAGRHEESGG